MCNLYRMSKSADEIARLFAATQPIANPNFDETLYPSSKGLVVADNTVRTMVWGFPLKLKSKKTGEPLKPKPVNNTRTDKLTSFMWRYSFEERRCLIPVSAWAEAEGPSGSKTRTWLKFPDSDVFAVAGIWRNSDEWGHCYSMVMTDAAGDAARVHSRMPVILTEQDYEQWTEGSERDAFALCQPYEGSLVIDRTDEPWVRR